MQYLLAACTNARIASVAKIDASKNARDLERALYAAFAKLRIAVADFENAMTGAPT